MLKNKSNKLLNKLKQYKAFSVVVSTMYLGHTCAHGQRRRVLCCAVMA